MRWGGMLAVVVGEREERKRGGGRKRRGEWGKVMHDFGAFVCKDLQMKAGEEEEGVLDMRGQRRRSIQMQYNGKKAWDCPVIVQ